MNYLYAVRTVATYEAKTLRRNKGLYVYCFLMILLFGVSSLMLNTMWNIRGVESFVPYMYVKNLLLLQTIFTVFFAADSIMRERKANTTDSIYPRSFPNAAYIMGKVLGILKVLSVILLTYLVFGVAFNLLFLRDVPLSLSGFLFYPLFMALPSLIFTIGATMFAAALFGGWFASVAAMLLLIFGSLVFAGDSCHHFFDIMCQTMPFTYSGFTGFGNPALVFAHASVYLLAGIGLIALTVLLMSRAAQSKTANRASGVLALGCLVCAVIVTITYVSGEYSGIGLRRDMISLQDSLSDMPQATITDCALDVRHSGGEIAVTADIAFTNAEESPMETVYFALNPGLTVESVRHDGAEIPFERSLHILSIEAPDGAVEPGEALSFTIEYGGAIDEHACYPEIDGVERNLHNMLLRYVITKRYAFITPRHVLLTHESGWYPVAAIRNGRGVTSARKTDFVNFRLDVTTDASLTAISQGAMESDGGGHFSFAPDTALPQISLIIGDYEKKSVTGEGIEYAIFMKKGHDYYSEYFEGMDDETLKNFIKDSRQRIGFRFQGEYPFKRLYFVETPVHFFAYEKDWGLSSDMAQPEQILFGEKGVLLGMSDMKMAKRSASRPRPGNTPTPSTIKMSMLYTVTYSFINIDDRNRNRMVMNKQKMMTPGFSPAKIGFGDWRPLLDSKTSIVPLFYAYQTNIASEKQPLLHAIITMFLQSGNDTNVQHQSIYYQGSLPLGTMALIALSKNSLKELIENDEQSVLAGEALKLKAKAFPSYCFAKYGVEYEAFKTVLNDILREHQYQSIDEDTFYSVLDNKLGIDLTAEFDNWYTRTELPEYEVHNLYYTEAVQDNKTVYQVRFVIHNKSDADGVVHVFLYGKEGNGDKYVHLEAGQAKEVGIVMLGEPVYGMRIDPFVSKHFVYIDNYVDKRDGRIDEVFHGDRVCELPQTGASDEIVVDNLDDGFEISSQPSDTIVMKLLAKMRKEDTDSVELLDIRDVPEKWTYGFNNIFYGRTIPSAHYIQAGKGDYHVTFSADIPQKGMYDLYFYTPDHQRYFRRYFTSVVYNFIVDHGEDVTEIQSDLTDTHAAWVNINNNSLKGWTKIGTYPCAEGPVTVRLTDETGAPFVYADAIKWQKHNGGQTKTALMHE